MTQSSAFMTKTLYLPKKNLTYGDLWLVSVDIGYSSVKCFTPNAVYSFPSFARERAGAMVGAPGDDDILYRGEDGVEWLVGSCAQNALSTIDTKDSEATLYERHRYYNPMFLVLARVALAYAMKENEMGRHSGRKLFVQTALPSSYLEADRSALLEVFTGSHRFSVRFGAADWQEFEIQVGDNVGVMDQAMAALFSAAKDDEGNTVTEEDGQSIIDGKVLVVEGGFVTFNTFSIFARQVIGDPHSFDHLSMKEVFSQFSKKLRTHGVDRKVHTMQQVLAAGSVNVFDRGSRSTKPLPIDPILLEASDEVMQRALSQLDITYNYLQEFGFLLLAGGTCAAWQRGFEEHYAGMGSLKVVSGDRNSDLDPIFSVARGCYLYGVLSQKALEDAARKQRFDKPAPAGQEEPDEKCGA